MGELAMLFLIKLITFPFVYGWKKLRFIMSEFVMELFEKEKPVKKILRMLPGLSVIFAITIFLYSIITFAMDGGYSEIINYISENGLFADSDGMLVSGNAGNFHTLWISGIFITIAIVEFVYASVGFLKKTEKSDRVGFYVFATLAVISVLMLLIGAIQIIMYIQPENIGELGRYMYMADIFEWLEGITGTTFLFGVSAMEVYYNITCIVAIVSLLVLYGILRSSVDWDDYASEIFGGLFVNMIFFPLVTVTLENILGLGVAILTVVIAFIAMLFVGGAALGGGGSTVSSSSSSNSESYISAKVAASEEKKRRERINYLENRIEANEHGLKEANKGSWGYGHVDKKGTRNTILNDRKELEMLVNQK